MKQHQRASIAIDRPEDEETTTEIEIEVSSLGTIPLPASHVQRRFPRFPTPRLPGSLAQPADSVVLDLSRHGACLETLYRLEEGRRYGVQLGADDGAQAVIEVRWCRLARVFRDEAGVLRRIYRAGGPFVRVLGTGATGLLGSLQPDPGLERVGTGS